MSTFLLASYLLTVASILHTCMFSSFIVIFVHAWKNTTCSWIEKMFEVQRSTSVIIVKQVHKNGLHLGHDYSFLSSILDNSLQKCTLVTVSEDPRPPPPGESPFFPWTTGKGRGRGQSTKWQWGNFGEGESFHLEGFRGIFPANPLDTGKGTGNIFI